MKKSNVVKNICIFLFSFLFFSCKNFLTDNNFIQTLQEAIDYSNSPYVNILISSDNEQTKEIIPAADFYENKYKVGDILDISFIENDNYMFLQWSIEPKDAVKFVDEEIQNPETERSISIKIINDVEQITIVPMVLERPSVVFYSPSYSYKGAYRDARIQVVFNKNMDSQSIYYTSLEIENITAIETNAVFLYSDEDSSKTYGYQKEDGSIVYKNIFISNRKTGSNLLACYGEPFFETEDTLVIPVKSVAQAPNSGSEIDVQISNFFYTDENTGINVNLSSVYEFFYYVNENTDNKSPTIPEGYYFNISGIDINDNSRLLTFAQNPDLSNTYPYTANQMREMYIKDNQLKIDALIYDEESGIAEKNGLFVVLTQQYDSAYKKVNDSKDKTVYFEGESIGQNGKYNCVFDLKSEEYNFDDGIYKLVFYAKDNNGNTSEPLQEFYILLDNTGPDTIQNINTTYIVSLNKMNVAWKNPENVDFNNCVISIVKNDDNSVIVENENIQKNLEYTFNNVIATVGYDITVETIDIFGNKGNVQKYTADTTPITTINKIEMENYNFWGNKTNQQEKVTIYLNTNAFMTEKIAELRIYKKENDSIVFDSNSYFSIEPDTNIKSSVVLVPLTFNSSNEYFLYLYIDDVEIKNKNNESVYAHFYTTSNSQITAVNTLSNNVIWYDDINNESKVKIEILGTYFNYVNIKGQIFNSSDESCFSQIFEIVPELKQNDKIITYVPIPKECDEYSLKLYFDDETNSVYEKNNIYIVQEKIKLSSIEIPRACNIKAGNIITAHVTGESFNFADLSKFKLKCNTIPEINTTNTQIIKRDDQHLDVKFPIGSIIADHIVTFEYENESINGIFKIEPKHSLNPGDIIMTDGSVIKYDANKTSLTSEEKKNNTISPLAIYFGDNYITGIPLIISITSYNLKNDTIKYVDKLQGNPNSGFSYDYDCDGSDNVYEIKLANNNSLDGYSFHKRCDTFFDSFGKPIKEELKQNWYIPCKYEGELIIKNKNEISHSRQRTGKTDGINKPIMLSSYKDSTNLYIINDNNGDLTIKSLTSASPYYINLFVIREF